MKVVKKMLTSCMAVLLALCSLAACGKIGSVESPKESNSGIVSSGKAQGSVFRLARGYDKAGIINHYHGGSTIGAIPWLSCEGLIQYVRTTDEIFYLLADSIEHNNDGTSTIHVREGAMWHDGQAFTAEDVKAYYSINMTTVTNYWSKVPEVIDEHTLKVFWKSWMEPTEDVKTMLLAMDKVGTVPYHVFGKYVDRALEILDSQESCEEGYIGWAPYNKLNDANGDAYYEYSANYRAFSNTSPEVFAATGPYKVADYNETQMIFVKNEDYYFADRIPYDTVICYNITDLSTIYAMLLSGELDCQDGFAPDAMIEQITQENEHMIHYKCYDPASVGILFNMDKPVWSDNVRLAFQYLFDREEMKNSANKYAIASYYPTMGICATEAKKYVSEDDFAKLPQYCHDEEMAAKLLEEEGWQKINGIWCDPEEKPIKLTLGYDGSNAIMSGLAEGVQGALNGFGINCELKRAADWGTWLSLASAENSFYDFSVNWTDISMSFAHPLGSFDYFFGSFMAPVMHLPIMKLEDVYEYDIPRHEIGSINLYLDKSDGSGKFHVYQYLRSMYSMKDDELNDAVRDMIFGIGQKNFGVTLFQNVAGGFYNSEVIGNLPMKDIWSSGTRNITTIPEMYSEDFYAVARISLEFAQEAALLFQHTDAAFED